MFASRHRGATSFRGRTLLTRSFRVRSALSAEKNMAVLDFLFSFLLSGVRFLSLLRSQPRRMGCTGCRRIPGGNDPRKRTIRKTPHQRPYRVRLTRGSWVPPANPTPPKDQLKKTPTKKDGFFSKWGWGRKLGLCSPIQRAGVRPYPYGVPRPGPLVARGRRPQCPPPLPCGQM